MPRTFPWHSTASDVYHNNRDCTAGNEIPQDAVKQGTGGKPLCPACAALNRKE